MIVPVKSPPNAKTRLIDAVDDSDTHARLVRAIQSDTIDAVVAARTFDPEVVARVHVVGMVPDGRKDVDVIEDPGGGLNAVIRHAFQIVRARYPDDGVAVLVADLPSLRPHDLLTTLDLAGRHGTSFVPDHAGSGTTMLTARPGTALTPLFGAESARRHTESGAVPVEAPDSIRSDVDTEADLQVCTRLGIGRHTATLLAVDAGDHLNR